MKLLTVGPDNIYTYDTVKEFFASFELGPKDLLVSIEVIYKQFLEPYANGANVILVDKYGAQEPTDVMIDEFIADAGKFDYDRIVAVGGGAVMDMSKVVAVAGGAVLVPELLYGLPDHVFATSSLDALVHSVESTLSPNSTPYTRMFGYEAMKMIISGYKAVAEAGPAGSPERRVKRNELMRDFLIASDYAGISFDTGGCAAVHALSYQLGGKYHVPHGESNYAMFTGVLRNYMEIKPEGEILKMNQFIADILGCDVADVYDALETLINKLLPKKALHEYGVTEQDLPEFADRVIKTQERLMKNCFVPLDYDRVLKIFKELY